MRHTLSVIFGAAAASGAGARRDGRRLAVLFLLPAAIMAIIGLAMGGYSTASFVVGVIDEAHTPQSLALIAGLASNEQYRVRDYTDNQKLRLAVFRGRMNAGIIFPPGWHGESNLQVYLTRAGAGSAIVQAGIDAELGRIASGSAPPNVPVRYPGGGHAGSPRVGYAYTAPGNLVLFEIINGFVSAIAILRLRESGISRRLLAAPRHTWELFLMLAVGPAQQMIAQAVFLIVAARLFFGVHWGDAMGLILITAAVVCLGVALVLLMATVFRTQQQATALGPWIGVALGMLGGCMWPLEIVPPIMKTVGRLTPAFWAMDAYLSLIFDHATLYDILPDVAMVFVFAMVIAAWGVMRLRPQFSR
jgi:ABC-2 type transport system permease protein